MRVCKEKQKSNKYWSINNHDDNGCLFSSDASSAWSILEKDNNMFTIFQDVVGYHRFTIDSTEKRKQVYLFTFVLLIGGEILLKHLHE